MFLNLFHLSLFSCGYLWEKLALFVIVICVLVILYQCTGSLQVLVDKVGILELELLLGVEAFGAVVDDEGGGTLAAVHLEAHAPDGVLDAVPYASVRVGAMANQRARGKALCWRGREASEEVLC